MKKKIKILSFAILFTLVISNLVFATSSDNAVNSAANQANLSAEVNTIEDVDLNTTDNIDEILEDDEIPELPDEFKYIEDDIPYLTDEYSDYYDDENNDDVFIINDTINIDGYTDGNVYLIGNTVNINSEEINGNVFIIANTVNINSYISMSSYIMANSINVKDSDLTDAYFLADKVNIDEDVIIYRNAKILSSSINMDGQIYGKLTYTGNLNKGENSIIEDIEEIETVDSSDIESSIKETTKIIKSFFEMWKICTAIIIIFVIVLLRKDNFSINKTTEDNKSIFYTNKQMNDVFIDIIKGLIYIVLCIIAFIILFVSLVGIPLGILLVLIYIITVFVAEPVACIEIAQMFKLKSNSKRKLKVIVALIAIAIYVVVALLKSFEEIKIIGSLLSFGILLYGLGTMVNWIFFRNKKKEEKIGNSNENSIISTDNNDVNNSNNESEDNKQ